MENNKENQKKVGRAILVIFLSLLALTILMAVLFSGDEDVKENESTEVVSKSVTDVSALCDVSATSIQKQTQLDKMKGKYVQWDGVVKNVDDYLMVNLCPINPLEASQMTIGMKEGQQNKMLELKAGDIVTFKAKFEIYARSGINGSDGEIIKVKK